MTLRRVLQVAHYYGAPGGIERVVGQFCRALRHDYQVEVLVSNESSGTLRTHEDGIPVTRVGRVAHVQRMSVCPTFPLWMRRMKPDLVHLHMINPMAETSFLLSGLRVPVVATYHMDLTRHRLLPSLYQPVQDRFLKRTSLVTASSDGFARSSPVLSRFMEKVRILPFGLAEDRFPETERSREFSAHLRESLPGKVILFVGRLIHYKGLHVLLEAMREVEAVCLIVGDGYLASDLKRWVSGQGMESQVRFLGTVPDEELMAYYDRADVFVLPSISRTESFGLTQIEAMSRGTPVVCTSLNTGTDFINREGETGFVVSPGDPSALAAAINRILSNPDLARRLSMNARQRYLDEFTESRMVAGLKAIYAEILEP